MALEITAPTYGPANANQEKSTQQDIGDKQVFLKLLIAQMQNQDPLNPSDATQMSTQLAQFNMVEQQTNTNALLQELVGAQSSGSSDSAASYLGKTVTVNQSIINFSGTAENFAIDVTGNTKQNYVVIADASGAPVRTYALGALAAGVHKLSWDGKTDAGAVAASGNYSIDVIAADADGLSVPVNVQRSGIVDAVRMTSSGVQLMVGGLLANVADVSEIRL